MLPRRGLFGSATVVLLSSAALLAPASGCSCDAGVEGTGGEGATQSGPGPSSGTANQGGSSGTFSTGSSTSTGPSDPCHVADDLDALPPCEVKAPADAFDPVVQWAWTAPTQGNFYSGSLVTPLVGNFTDDDANGEINLCDVPDVLVEVFAPGATGAEATIYVLSGATGEQEAAMNGVVDGNINPAFGDLDQDGLPEVVAATPQGNVIIFEHDGTLKLTGAKGTWPTYGDFGGSANLGAYCHAFAIYDLDADGSPEILGGFDVFDAGGQLLWTASAGLNDIPGEPFWCPTPTAADLDGDGKLEVIYGHAAYHHDGQLDWQVGGNPGHPHVANFDDDPEPEVLVNTDQGISLIQHDGVVTFANQRPSGEAPSARCWGKPGVIHDFDGDGKADLATGTCLNYSMYKVTTSLATIWTQPVSDQSGLATGTAFDFLGDGIADAIYADETTAYVFEGSSGMLELSVPRSSGTLVEYPVVADIDNDGSAEFIVVSNSPGGATGETLTVYRDAMDRWTPARRIWNQHAYHVTNVREDGTIPQNMKKSWQLLNTFRTNSQVEAGGNCEPPVPR
ncbi:MAG: VCBS repeat-containing protein [Myxococcales bacterium]|nr:VCBS repeat-containing protein [Myxococcales bacterium]